MRIWGDVYNAAGTLQGEGPITNIQSAKITRKLDGTGSVVLSVPAGDERVQDLIQNERRIKLYTYQNSAHRLLGVGIVRGIKGNSEGIMLDLSGPDQMDELKRANTLLARIYNGVSLETAIDSLIALSSGWTATKVNLPSSDAYMRFDGASVLKALQEICVRYGLHMRWDADQTLRIGVLGDSAGVRVMQAPPMLSDDAYDNPDVIWIDRLVWDDTTEALANWIIPLGGGQGGSAIDLEYCTRTVDRYEAYVSHPLSFAVGARSLKYPDGITKWGQSFVGEGKWTGRVRLALQKIGTPADTLTLRIETDSGGSPSGTLANARATTTVAESSLPQGDSFSYVAPTWVDFTFAENFYLDDSTTYWLVLTSDGVASWTDYIIWWDDDGNTPEYADGEMQYYNGSWSGPGSYMDFMFEVCEFFDSRSTEAIAEYGPENWDTYHGVQQTTDVELDTSGATKTATSEYYPISQAFDGITFTWWQTVNGVTTATVEIDFGTLTSLKFYDLRGTYPYAPTGWTFSAYNGSWSVVHTQSGVTWTMSQTKRYEAVTSGTKFKWEFTGNQGGTTLRLYEIYLFGPQAVTQLAQSFDGDGGRVSHVNLWLSRRGTAAGNATIEIQGDSSGSPDGSAMATSDAVAVAALDSNLSKVPFTFSSPPELTNGTTYWLVLKSTASADGSNYLRWAADETSPSFADGEMKRYADSVWTALSADAIFQVIAECEVHPYAIQSTTGPDGATLYYLADSDSITAYGQIQRVLKVNISPLEHTADGLTAAANALYDAAAAWLQRYAQLQTTYSLNPKGVQTTLKPGMKIPVLYKGEVVDDQGNLVGWRDIDGEFWIAEVSEHFGTGGVEVSLKISDVDLQPADIASDIMTTLEKVELRDVEVRPTAATYTYAYEDLISGSKNYTLSAGSGSGTVNSGKNAEFNIPVPSAIMEMVSCVVRIRTKPPRVFTLTDTDGYQWFGADEGTNYPAGLSILIDGTDRSSALGGPWLTGTGDNQEFDETFDITAYLRDTDGKPDFGDHTLTVQSAGRTISGSESVNVSGYRSKTVSTPSPAPGMVECTITMQCITQPISA